MSVGHECAIGGLDVHQFCVGRYLKYIGVIDRVARLFCVDDDFRAAVHKDLDIAVQRDFPAARLNGDGVLEPHFLLGISQ